MLILQNLVKTDSRTILITYNNFHVHLLTLKKQQNLFTEVQ